MEQLKALTKARGRLKARITRLFAYAENPPADYTSFDVDTKIEGLVDAWKEFTKLGDELELLDHVQGYVNPTTDNEAYEERYEDALSLLKAMQAKCSAALKLEEVSTAPNDETLVRLLQQQLELQREESRMQREVLQQQLQENRDLVQRLVLPQSNVSSQAGVQQNTVPIHKDCELPKIQIKPFGGDYMEWHSFKDLFESTVHTKMTLTNTQRFHHLKSCLIGEAASLIQHLPIIDANYNVAWKALIERYEKPRYLVNLLLDTFTNLPVVVGLNPSSLRSLTAGAGDVIRALDASGQTGRDCWLIYLLMAKLDEATRREWIDKSQHIDGPTIEDLLKFLDTRCDRLELSQKAEKSTKQTKQQSADKGKWQARVLLANMGKCVKCDVNEHTLFACPQFQNMSIKQRYDFVKNKRLCFNCLRPGHVGNSCESKSSCKHCKRRHHSLLHPVEKTPHGNALGLRDSVTDKPDDVARITSLVATMPDFIHPSTEMVKPYGPQRSTLPTALVLVQDFQGNFITCRILLDCGSELSYVSERCMQTLGLRRSPSRILVSGISSVKADTTRGLCTLHIRSRVSQHSLHVTAHVLGRITSTLCRENIDDSALSFYAGYELADPAFNTNATVDILLGNDHIWSVLSGDKLRDDNGNVVAIATIFGWVITAVIGSKSMSSTSFVCTIDIDTLLRRFWELDDVSQRGCSSPEHKLVETHFQTTHTRTASGRYVVELPFKETPEFADTLHGARSRFLAVERRLLRDAGLRTKYIQFMREYIQLGHMREVDSEDATSVDHFYMPHHPVVGTKLRVVFDGSFKDRNGCALNDLLHVGPCIQRNLFEVCLRFRMYKFVFAADIVKMFRQVLVAEKHQQFQRILWREDPALPLKHFQLRTVTYGTACAPFLAVRVLEQLANDHKDEFPRAARVLLEDFYVDDVLTGAMTEDELWSIREELIQLMSCAQLQLGKWVSNSERIAYIEETNTSTNEVAKVLGLHWQPREDILTCKFSLCVEPTCTKRQVLSDVARIYDPLGIFAPVVVQFKILLQELWLLNLEWDAQLPTKQAQLWRTYRKDLLALQHFKVPRFVENDMDAIELHAFSDASERAYSAVVYSRFKDGNGTTKIFLIAAKTRVAPLKQKTLPRLELCGALLLARLVHAIKTGLRQRQVQIYAWCDSTIVLSWLSHQPCKLKTFVANRTSEILEIVPRNAWRHVSGKENPADCASRGMLATDLLAFDLWWEGPTWLHNDDDYAEVLRRSHDSCLADTAPDVEFKTKALTTTVKEGEYTFLNQLVTRMSSWSKLIRVIAYMQRFINRLKLRARILKSAALNYDEIDNARKLCVRLAQSDFDIERQLLLKRQPISHRSKLFKLAPFIDDVGIIRVGGRLENSQLPNDTKHPAVLPKHHRLVYLLLRHEHQVNLHPGVSALFVIVRQKYWIIGARNLIRRVTYECLRCFRQRQPTTHQFMANLPAVRVRQAFAFEHTGCDYAGPITLKVHKGRNPRKEKGYICLFVCMVTSAIHLELATDLSTSTFLAALRRFMARRGKCAQLYSDNGRNFVGANRVLNELQELHTSTKHNETVSLALAEEGIKWNFIPPYSPHWGGKWESSVRSVKLHLRRVIGHTIITFEQMHTLLAQIEAIVNSRPMYATSDTDIAYLSPAHFLIGRPYTTTPEGNYEKVPTNRLDYWQHIQAMLQGFWKRWQQEYLTSLQQRPKWNLKRPNISIGNIVLIKESNAPPSAWNLGLVQDVYPGDDGLVRAVKLKTASGETTRPITKVAVLPYSETRFQGGPGC